MSDARSTARIADDVRARLANLRANLSAVLEDMRHANPNAGPAELQREAMAHFNDMIEDPGVRAVVLGIVQEQIKEMGVK